jgi:hypothetical protein
MSLPCKKCSGRNTKVVPEDKFREIAGSANSVNAMSGKIPLTDEQKNKIEEYVIELIKKIIDLVFDKLFPKKNMVVVCMDCGHWERI